MESMKYLNTPLSNVDINQAIKELDNRGANIKQVKDITIDTPFENMWDNRGHIIFFKKWDGISQIGHWFPCIRDKETVFIADSLAQHPDKYNKNLIPWLKQNGIKNIIINKKKWQNNKSALCGRYGITVPIFNKLKMTIPEIYEFMDNGKNKEGSYDKFILTLTT